VDESEDLLSFRRVVTIEANAIAVSDCPGTNAMIGTSDKAYVLRLNEGLSDGTADPPPFVLVPVAQHRVTVGKGQSWRLPNQVLLKDQYDEKLKAKRVDGGEPAVSVRLMSRKTTDALFLTPAGTPPGIDLGRIGRRISDTGVRAALVSATQLLVQRAALELDLDPEEFDVLEPRVREGRPVLQIADYLPNGAGFSRRLSEGDLPMIVDLARAMVTAPAEDRLVATYLDADHRDRCKAACYRCLQRYGNRSYHGLLDWRLGLSALRIFVDSSWKGGLDGRWDDAVETQDWEADARRLADNIAALSPDVFEVQVLARSKLPAVVTKRGASERFVLVHPFWSPSGIKRRIEGDSFAGRTMYVDSFQASRRPQRVIELCRAGEMGALDS
jgi:hypothetical protein